MASTRESSPASEITPDSPTQLSPNSKVKALLATIQDDSSDDESVSGSARARVLKALKKTTPTKTKSSVESTKPSDSTSQLITQEHPTESENDDEEEDIIRPKGRLAARMQAKDNSSGEEARSNSDSNTTRRKENKIASPKSKSPAISSDTAMGASSDEDEGPAIPRRRKNKPSHQDTPESSPRRRSASPGLFVSPAKPRSTTPGGDNSDSDDLPDLGSDRFAALIAKKREERLARDAIANEEKAKEAAERKKYASILDNELDESDEEGGRRLSQKTRPSRKASKKALEEMHRETQRLSRNQQLAHNAITKKKVTKESLFAKFNYMTARPENASEQPCPTSSSSPDPISDLEMKDTPPTSPVSRGVSVDKALERSNLDHVETAADDEELPSLEEVMSKGPSPVPTTLDKGKGIAPREPSPEEKPQKKHSIRVRLPKAADRKLSTLDESDSDLEIVAVKTPIKTKMDAIFDRVPAKQSTESHALYALKMLANFTSPGKQNAGRNKKPSMSTPELQMTLQQRARQQAAREREERLQALREKGVIVQTAEEREREMVEFDDLLSKARQEDEVLTKQERAEAKKERKANGEEDPLGDSSDDEDWKEENEALQEELSGSDDEENEAEPEGSIASEEEDEGDEMSLDEDENAEAQLPNPIFDDEAADSDVDEEEAHVPIDDDTAEDGDVDEDDEEVAKPKIRRARKSNVISDDEDEDDDHEAILESPITTRIVSPMQTRIDSPMAPPSVLRSATKTFIPGLTVAGPAGLGLTQIFAGTMDDSQVEPFENLPSTLKTSSASKNTTRDLSFLRRGTAPELPPFVPTMEEDTQDAGTLIQSQISHVPASQPETQEIQLEFNQSQIHEFDSLVQDPFTQMSQFPEATQDLGFQQMTPIKGRYVDLPQSTVDTVMLESTAVPETTVETPIVKKKGRLQRRVQIAAFSDDEDLGEVQAANVEEEDFDITADAFDMMRKASKKKAVVVDDFDKKKSKAKEMVQEQAEESEDEYAGLGGNSDDESEGDDELVKEMIDDNGGEKVDERQIAAFFADRERKSDEKHVEKLYKDITNGMLRRKRGADYDLSDSDDGGEARQRMKRKEFAKMRKALLADERIGKIAENPKKQAFLRAIEDRGSEDEMDFLGDFEDPAAIDSQSQSQSEEGPQAVPDSQSSMGSPKRKQPGDATEAEARPAPHLRRTNPMKKPSNLSDIRDSLSSLIEEPNAVQAALDSGSESEDDLEVEDPEDLGTVGIEKNKENRDPFALRRTHATVIDRISLKRASSSMISNSTKLAFTASTSALGFKVPPLLRRATTNQSIASSTTNSSVSGGVSTTERMAGGMGGSDGVKRGGGKNSGVNYFARESERRANVEKGEKRREKRLAKGAKARSKVVGGLFGGGKFE